VFYTALSLITNQHELTRIDRDANSAQFGLIRVYAITKGAQMHFECRSNLQNAVRIQFE